VPEGENLDAARLGIHLVIEVIARTAEEKAPNALLLGIAGSRPDAGLRGDELEGSLEVVGEGKGGCLPIGSPPR